MRPIRRTAVIGVAVVALMGAGAGVASAKANGSAEQVGGIYFAGHASGSLSKASGGFEAWDYDGTDPRFYYISGKVDCYAQPTANTAVFSATIAKGDLKGEAITFWLTDGGPNGPDYLGYALDVEGCPSTQQNMKPIESDGYITIK